MESRLLTEDDVITLPIRTELTLQQPKEIFIPPTNFQEAEISCSLVSLTPAKITWEGTIDLSIEYDWNPSISFNAESKR